LYINIKRLGVYIPIILPFVYPILMGLIDEIKDSKIKNRKVKVE
jgi:hypothetical protein